ncbi:ComF family protein [Lactobacillus xylocopicola]|uniref:ComF family protein n=1 Tax=Lactobacillus xylocopicola TaxID=2976676 RepID=UPI0029542E4A|nr:ComF family protein [Lactobacillus xylocopicola]
MKKCLLCGQLFVPRTALLHLLSWHLHRQAAICSPCLAKFERLAEPKCRICAGQLVAGQGCDDCQRWQQIYGKKILFNHAVYRYNEACHDLMVNFKRYGDYLLYQVLQELCYRELSKIKADFYVPVPTSPEHLAQRQFDTISAIYGDLVPLSNILLKGPGYGAQGEKTRADRLSSQQSFTVAKKTASNLNKHKVLLLDDIYTTGRTLYHARDALLSVFPQAQITSFTICR